MAEDQTYLVRDRNGTVAPVSKELYEEGIAAGDFEPVDPAVYALQQRREDRGALDYAAAAGLGLANKLSGDRAQVWAADIGGEDARQNILAMREDMPGWVTAGEVGGMVLPALMGRGRGFGKANAPGFVEPPAATSRLAQGIRTGFQWTPSGLISRTGNAVEGLAARGLARTFGEPSSFLGTVAQRGAAMAAGGAVEGALWGGAAAISEDQLHNRPMSAESLLWGTQGAGTGLSRGQGVLGGMLWGGVGGGVVGGGLGGGGYAARKGYKAASEFTRREGTNLLGRAMGIPDGSPEEITEAWLQHMSSFFDDVSRRQGAKAMGATTPDLRYLRKMAERQPGAKAIIDQFAAGELPFQQARGGRPWRLDTAIKDLEDLQRSVKEGFDAVETTAERLMPTNPRYRAYVQPSDAVQAGMSPADSVTFHLKADYKDFARLTPHQPAAKEYKAFFDAMSADTKQMGGLSLRNLRAYRQMARERYLASSGEASRLWAKTTEALEAEAEALADRISAEVPGFGQQYKHLKDITPATKWLEGTLLGKAAKDEAAPLLDSYSVFAMLWGGPISSAAMATARKSAREYANTAAAAGAKWASRRLSPRQEALAAVDRSTRNTETVVNKAVGSFIRGMRRAGAAAVEGGKATGRAAEAAGAVGVRLPQKAPSLGGAYADKERKAKETRLTNAEIQKRAEAIKAKLAKVNADPEVMLNDIETLAGPLAYHAPGVYGELSGTMARAYDVLRKYAPVSRGGANYLLAHQDPKTIDPDQARKLVKVAMAIDDPIMVLDKMGVNGLSPEELDAIKTVYPQVFSLIQERIIDELTNGDVHPTYEEKITLTMVTGVPADYSMTKTAILSSQMTYKPAEKIETRAVESDTPKRPLDLASDMRTEITIQEAGGRF